MRLDRGRSSHLRRQIRDWPRSTNAAPTRPGPIDHHPAAVSAKDQRRPANASAPCKRTSCFTERRSTASWPSCQRVPTAAPPSAAGRPFRGGKQITLLPKRIALPVFASDAIILGGVRPEEIPAGVVRRRSFGLLDGAPGRCRRGVSDAGCRCVVSTECARVSVWRWRLRW